MSLNSSLIGARQKNSLVADWRRFAADVKNAVASGGDKTVDLNGHKYRLSDIADYFERLAAYVERAGITYAELALVERDAVPCYMAARPIVYGTVPHLPKPQQPQQPANAQNAQKGKRPQARAQQPRPSVAAIAVTLVVRVIWGILWGAFVGALGSAGSLGRAAALWARRNAQMPWARLVAPYVFGALMSLLGIPVLALAGAIKGAVHALR
ncbi:MAG: hypothetical protein KatS3mg038_1022 [Candidatus Kapaibacterium sp.]|nr:MAG: hypothetical protein KatS3mg038_1022 [Candidatus Kapabacteria bacterium]